MYISERVYKERCAFLEHVVRRPLRISHRSKTWEQMNTAYDIAHRDNRSFSITVARVAACDLVHTVICTRIWREF